MKTLALLWQIYSGRRSLQIHFRQCGHRCEGGGLLGINLVRSSSCHVEGRPSYLSMVPHMRSSDVPRSHLAPLTRGIFFALNFLRREPPPRGTSTPCSTIPRTRTANCSSRQRTTWRGTPRHCAMGWALSAACISAPPARRVGSLSPSL